MIKRAAIISPREKQGTLQSRLARIDEMLAMRARYEALLRQAPAPATRSAANSRTQGKSQQQYSRTQGGSQQYSRTNCENCGSTVLLTYANGHGVECYTCGHISPRWTPVDTNRHPGEAACKHCHSIDVVFRERTLICRVCRGETPRWP